MKVLYFTFYMVKVEDNGVELLFCSQDKAINDQRQKDTGV